MNFANTCVSLGLKAIQMIKDNEAGIKIVSGVALMAGGAIAAAYETTKAEKVLSETKKALDCIEEARETCSEEEYSKKDVIEDKTKVYTRAAVGFVRLYALPLVMEVVGGMLIFSGYNVMNRKLLGAAAAYKALDEAFETYRDRVRREEGVEKDDYYRYGIKSEKIVTKDSNGKKTEALVTTYDNLLVGSCYSRFFDHIPGRAHCKDDPHTLRDFLIQTEETANYILERRASDTIGAVGKLYLNEVYEMLGLDDEKSTAGEVVGWYLDPKDYDGRSHGINKVSFGILKQANERFNHGLERSALLDFNVDGIIYNKLYKREV